MLGKTGSHSPPFAVPNLLGCSWLRSRFKFHGCFWHGHPHCPDFRLPATRREWWRAKIDGNRARDLRVQHELQNLGWHVVTVWACAVKSRAARSWLEKRIPRLVERW